jgi:hypothetical protein
MITMYMPEVDAMIENYTGIDETVYDLWLKGLSGKIKICHTFFNFKLYMYKFYSNNNIFLVCKFMHLLCNIKNAL